MQRRRSSGTTSAIAVQRWGSTGTAAGITGATSLITGVVPRIVGHDYAGPTIANVETGVPAAVPHACGRGTCVFGRVSGFRSGSHTGRRSGILTILQPAPGRCDHEPRPAETRVFRPTPIMLFTKHLRDRIRSGRIKCSVRIWLTPRVKVGGRYRMDEGLVVVDSITKIRLADITGDLARESGFSSVKDLLGTAKHGAGNNVYLIRFHYLPPGAWDLPRRSDGNGEHIGPDAKPSFGRRSQRNPGSLRRGR